MCVLLSRTLCASQVHYINSNSVNFFSSSSYTHLHFKLEEAGIMNRLPHFFVSHQKGDGEEVMI